jgi:hypothetical protein
MTVVVHNGFSVLRGRLLPGASALSGGPVVSRADAAGVADCGAGPGWDRSAGLAEVDRFRVGGLPIGGPGAVLRLCGDGDGV